MSRRGEKIQVKKDNVLLVEGGEDQKLFWKLTSAPGLEKDIQVFRYEGKGGVRGFLGAIQSDVRRRGVLRLGITMDADDDYQGAVDEIKQALMATGFDAPEEELTLAGAEPQTIFMVLPGGGRNGMIEDLCLDSVATDPAISCVDEYIRCLRAQGIDLPANRLSKAREHAFLASRPEPAVSIGEAAQEGYWHLNRGTAFEEPRRLIRLLAGKRQ